MVIKIITANNNKKRKIFPKLFWASFPLKKAKENKNKNKTKQTKKVIGLDFPKKLVNIVSFYIFADVKIIKLC